MARNPTPIHGGDDDDVRNLEWKLRGDAKPNTPELRLLLAVANQAIDDLQSEALRESAVSYILSKEEDSPFAFSSILTTLDINFEAAIGELKVWEIREAIMQEKNRACERRRKMLEERLWSRRR